ncbi:Ribonuclease P protein subunit p30 [Mactra antiquata]
MAAPMDLNIPHCDENLLKEKLCMSHQLGYEVVAINYYDPELLIPKKQKKKDDAHQVKSPDKILPSKEVLQSITKGSRKPFKVLSRVSTILTEETQAHKLISEEVQQFDLIAVQPTSEKTFLQACQTLNVDIITIDVTEKFNMKMRRQTISPALERGVYFELQYSPSIRDSTYRQYLIANAQKLMFWCKGKNVILTSGCEKAMELRGPYDVANLGLLFDLNENQAKDTVMKNCQAVLSHSEGRKDYTKSTIKVEKVKELSKTDMWIVDKSDALQNCEEFDLENNAVSDLHQFDSSDNDDEEEDHDSDAVESEPKKIKLMTT